MSRVLGNGSVSRVTRQMSHGFWKANFFLPELELSLESSNLYWKTKKKSKTMIVCRKKGNRRIPRLLTSIIYQSLTFIKIFFESIVQRPDWVIIYYPKNKTISDWHIVCIKLMHLVQLHQLHLGLDHLVKLMELHTDGEKITISTVQLSDWLTNWYWLTDRLTDRLPDRLIKGESF